MFFIVQGCFPPYSPQQIDIFLDSFCSLAKEASIYFRWRPFLPDPKDDMVLEATVAASADYLVTFNTSDFDGASSLGVRVITPPQFLALIPSALP